MLPLPEFIQPTCNAPENPESKTNLSEFLQSQLGNQYDTLTALANAQALLEKLNLKPNEVLWLDLEISPKTEQLLDGALLLGDYYWQFNAVSFQENIKTIFQIIQSARYLGGHHLIEFDLPRLINFIDTHQKIDNIEQILAQWQAKTWDTLILSCLFIPHQPTHALAKLYKANTTYNHPVKDCLESRLIFKLCETAWQQLSLDYQTLYKQLLPTFKQLANQTYFFSDTHTLNLDAIASTFAHGNQAALQALLQHACDDTATKSHTWQHLGLACFVNWLRYFAKPQARRPVWISKHPVHRTAFHQAESAFWQIDNPSETWINAHCREFFGFDSLRDGQMQIVKATLANQDIPLGILPTGGGKSLTFQLPALIFSKYYRQLTVIISPLKALIEDQVINLRAQLPDYENRIAYLTSGQTPETQKTVMTGVWQGDIDILYLSPERLRTHGIRQLLKNRPPAFWVLDEAHTLSQWGTDFRPDFLRVADHIMACYAHLDVQNTQTHPKHTNKAQPKNDAQYLLLPSETDTTHLDSPKTQNGFIAPRISLVTATASSRVKEDLDKELVNKLFQLTTHKSLVQYGTPVEQLQIWRDNIEPIFLQVAKDDRLTQIYQILRERQQWYEQNYPESPEQGIALVYLRNRKRCEEYAKHFSDKGIQAVAYHSKLDESQKKQILQQFKNNELQVIVCTNAFGMGIDKAGIHTVIHDGVPNNLESYVQETGRGARKPNERAQAYMLWDSSDIEQQFQQERLSRIPNTDTLKNCWQQIHPVLKRPLDEQWFAGSLLLPILNIDEPEQLNTQIRVALLALERYGLLIEKEQQPAWIHIQLLNRPTDAHNHQLIKLYNELQQYNDQPPTSNPHHQPKQEPTRYHLPELATALGYSVKQLLNSLRQLVNLGFAQWQVMVNIRLSYSIRHLKSEFNKKRRILNAIKTFVNDELFKHTDQHSGTFGEFEQFDCKALDHWLLSHQYPFRANKDVFALLRALNIITTRHQSRQYFAISSTSETKAALAEQQLADGWHNWLKLAEHQLGQLAPLLDECIFIQLQNKDKNSSDNFLLDDIAKQFNRSPIEVLHQLEQLQRLDIIELSRLDDDASAIFFIGANASRQQYNAVAYRYLQTHYEDRCARIHVLNHWLNSDLQTKRSLLEDYFKNPLSDVVKRYLPEDVHVTRPYLKDYQKLILPKHFSDVQKQIITDKSRASMILAGPGSGKTTVVVHRVAHLLMIEEIKPEKILVLAYNRLAVCELKERLKHLVGHHANGVTIVTFHALARQITGLCEKDAPKEQLQNICARIPHLSTHTSTEKALNNARYQWMIEQAISHLQDSPQYFQYIMVDEFQDIDAYQYQLIGLLADLQEVGADNETSEQTDNYEQRSYLTVVGDDDQNLYAFRGASIKFIQQFEQNYHINVHQKYYLLNNYRSADNIVKLANEFISQALDKTERLKDTLHHSQPTQAQPNLPIRYGMFEQAKDVDMAYWLANDIQEKLAQFKSLAHKPSIAVLAPQWRDFDAVQHYLELLSITSQRYNESEQIIPLNSAIGQALYQFLDRERLSVIDGSVVAFLENWRQQMQLTALDKAWQAILAVAKELSDVSYDYLLRRLETAHYASEHCVYLVSYHSAKGMEFDHVYVIDKCPQHSQDSVRPLYVALTRAKQSLTVLQQRQQHHHILAKLLISHAEQVTIAPVPQPEYLSFHRFLQLEEIFLTPQALVSESGRQFVANTFIKDGWGKSEDVFSKFLIKTKQMHNTTTGFYSPRGQFICGFSKHLEQKLNQNTTLSLAGFTTTRFYQQDMTWYEKAAYQGDETSHLLIVPFVRFLIQ